MSNHPSIIVSQHKTTRSRVMTYIVGYMLSVFLTLAAYLLVKQGMSSQDILIGLIIGLAFVQLLVQLLFFLHLGTETKPRWKLLVFMMMLLVVSILVFGSLWIMRNLNYRMTPQQVNNYMNNQDVI